MSDFQIPAIDNLENDLSICLEFGAYQLAFDKVLNVASKVRPDEEKLKYVFTVSNIYLPKTIDKRFKIANENSSGPINLSVVDFLTKLQERIGYDVMSDDFNSLKERCLSVFRTYK